MKRWLKNNNLLIKIFISMAIMGLLALRIDFHNLNNIIGDIQISVWAIALLLIFLQILALSWRWALLINAREKRISYRGAIRVTLASLIANYLFITSVGGIVVRIALSMKSGISFIHSLAATALDRAMTLGALLILAALFLPVLGGIVTHDIYKQALMLFLTFSIGATIFAILLFEAPRRKIIFSHRKVTMCFKYLRTIMTDPNLLAKIIFSSLLGQISYFAAVYAITLSMGISFSWLHFMAVLPLITVVASLPVGYGGWGIREGAFVYGLGLISVPVETAFAVSIQIGLISMISALIAGIPAIATSRDFRLTLRNWKHITFQRKRENH